MKDKWFIIVISVMVIAFGIYIAVDNTGRKTNISQPNTPATPTAPTAPTVAEPAVNPGTTPVVGSSGAIEITAKKLISDVRNDPYKYNPGTIFRISGIVERVVSQGGSGYTLYIGPKVKENVILVQFFRTSLNADEEKQFSALEKLRGGEQIVIQGSYIGLIGEFVSLQNPLLVSIK